MSPTQDGFGCLPEPEPDPSQSHVPGGISPAIWEDFSNRYAESGKRLGETDWVKASMEAVTLNLSDSDMTERVIPRLAAELPGWADRDTGMIPYPANWLAIEMEDYRELFKGDVVELEYESWERGIRAVHVRVI